MIKYYKVLIALVLVLGCVKETDPIDEIPVTWDRSSPINAVNWFMNCWNQQDLTRYSELLAEDFIFHDNTYGSNTDTTIWNKEAELGAAVIIYNRFPTIVMELTDPRYSFKDINEEDIHGNLIIGKVANINMKTDFTSSSEQFTITATESLTFILDPQDSSQWVLKKWESVATTRAKSILDNISMQYTWSNIKLK